MSRIPEDYIIWAASWGTNDGYVPKDIYKYQGNHDIWQYTSKREDFPGVPSEFVDVNIAYRRIFK